MAQDASSSSWAGIDGVEDPWRFFLWLLERGVAGGLSLVFPDIALDLFVRALCPASIQIPTARIVRSPPAASHPFAEGYNTTKLLRHDLIQRPAHMMPTS
ncbi:hypothetical protein CCMSSC00406_0009629 [Pleurotus cornucopiae]|uniref:Uncharacterized protein n=1 Tax=Pleurotus cornucopiae TaxID=5321 RepID=A0ACB7J947_PLECO|nr:hypothetical protein CCMSSC00406_0009629 [Pleurotus cornucopiae]